MADFIKHKPGSFAITEMKDKITRELRLLMSSVDTALNESNIESLHNDMLLIPIVVAKAETIYLLDAKIYNVTEFENIVSISEIYLLKIRKFAEALNGN